MTVALLASMQTILRSTHLSMDWNLLIEVICGAAEDDLPHRILQLGLRC